MTGVQTCALPISAYIGVGTILILILWAKFAPKQLKWIPGALVAVVAATAVSSALNLPIKYVQLSNNFLGAIQFLPLRDLPHLINGDILMLAFTVAFVASAETLLSAAAVDQMHDGPRANYNKELISQGVGNTLCGIVGSLPMTGVIVRSATNVAAGAKTRLSAILHGVCLLALVAAFPGLLRMIPTASLAAVLVYTGYKLVNVQNIRRLLQYGGMPVAIYAVTLTVIIVEDLLTGIIVGLLLSLATVVYSMTHLAIDVEEAHGSILVTLKGAATFLRMPKLIDRLEQLPHHVPVHVHVARLTYIDHACLDAIAGWERQRNEKHAETVVEWQELMSNYQRANPLAANVPERPVVGAGH